MSKDAFDVYSNEIFDGDKCFYWRGKVMMRGEVAWTHDGEVRFEGENYHVRNVTCIVLERSLSIFKTNIMAGDTVLYKSGGHLWEGSVVNTHKDSYGQTRVAIRNSILKRADLSKPQRSTREFEICKTYLADCLKVKDGKKAMIETLKERDDGNLD